MAKRGSGQAYKTIICGNCNRTIPMIWPAHLHNKRKYCSVKCANEVILGQIHHKAKLRHIRRGYVIDATSGEFIESGRRKYRPEHVLIVEKVLGHPLPSTAVVHHHDGNKSNNLNSNLVVCENQAYHNLLHARTRTLRAGGDPNLDKVCSDCEQPRPHRDFYSTPSKYDGRSNTCRDCNRKYCKRRRMSTNISEKVRPRRPKARHRDTVIGAAEENLLMLDQAKDLEAVRSHTSRLRELLEELRRSLGKDEE